MDVAQHAFAWGFGVMLGIISGTAAAALVVILAAAVANGLFGRRTV